MTELKTHLLYEVLDLAFKKKIKATIRHQLLLDVPKFWKFDGPQDTCALAISSSHGYRMVAYIVKHIATWVSGKTEFRCGFALNQHIFAPILSFSSEYHIRRIMNLAGRYCTKVESFKYRDKGIGHFCDGLAYNNSLCATDVADDQRLFTAYMKGRTFVKSLLCCLTEFTEQFHCLKHIGDAVIGSLVIDGFFKSSAAACILLKGLKIESLHILPNICQTKLSRDIFYRTTPQLKYMKRFRCGNKIDIGLTTKMLKRYHIDDVFFDDVRFVKKLMMPFEDIVQSVKQAMDALWKAVEKNKGTRIRINCNLAQRFLHPSPTAMIVYLHEQLPDFETDYDGCIECKYSKTVGLKSLNVFLGFFLS
uniref:DDE Tnp4 domain-containing protein n=1 Tax=Panagrellus redivivus TaxID=6233 RepID=A0A7E4WDV3_PANRE